jgi:predicted alpha/beta hydrolase
MTKGDWIEFVQICGWTLARAHARTGDAAMIGGYLGKNDAFDLSLAKFAISYADQAERDYDLLVKAIRARRLKARTNAAA